VCLLEEIEEFAIVSAKHRSWFLFDRVARLAERGEDYFCHVCLPEIERAAAAVFHGLGRKRSHLASTEMVREELERSRAAMRPNSVVLKSSHLSGINRWLERLQCISDIQRQIGKPITMPTANVAKK